MVIGWGKCSVCGYVFRTPADRRNHKLNTGHGL